MSNNDRMVKQAGTCPQCGEACSWGMMEKDGVMVLVKICENCGQIVPSPETNESKV